MKEQRELKDNEIMLCRLGYSDELDIYLIMGFDKVRDTKQYYKISQWNNLSKYYWTKYDLTLKEALKWFNMKLNNNSSEIAKVTKETIQDRKSIVQWDLNEFNPVKELLGV